MLGATLSLSSKEHSLTRFPMKRILVGLSILCSTSQGSSLHSSFSISSASWNLHACHLWSFVRPCQVQCILRCCLLLEGKHVPNSRVRDIDFSGSGTLHMLPKTYHAKPSSLSSATRRLARNEIHFHHGHTLEASTRCCQAPHEMSH